MLAQNSQELTPENVDSLLIEYIELLSSSENNLLEITSLLEGKRQMMTLNNQSLKFLFEVQKHYRIGYRYLIEDYGNYGPDQARYLADGIHHQSINKPIYYHTIKQINRLSRKMLRTKRMHRFLHLRDKMLWQIHELKSITVPS